MAENGVTQVTSPITHCETYKGRKKDIP